MDQKSIEGAEPEALTDAIGQLFGLENAARRELLSFVVAYDDRELWRSDGCHSMASWLAFKLGVSSQLAHQVTKVAQALEELPVIAATFAQGKLSWEQLCACCDIATPQRDAAIAKEATTVTLACLKGAARQARTQANRLKAPDHRLRSLRWRTDIDTGWVFLSAKLTPDPGAVVTACLEHLITEIPREPDGLYGSYPSRAADALTELSSTRLAGCKDADRATVVLHVDHGVLTGDKGSAETHNGALLDTQTTRKLACDARLQVVSHGHDGRPLSIGRTSRKVPLWLVRQLRRRDRGCRFRGCGRTRFLHAHHVTHWADGGATDIDNLIHLCAYHHRLLHEGGWSMRGDPNGEVVFIRPDGREVRAGPPALRSEIRARFLPATA